MDGLMVEAMVGGVFGLLLSVIAYFLKLLIQDVRQVSKELAKLKESVIRLEAAQALVKALLQNRVSSLKMGISTESAPD